MEKHVGSEIVILDIQSRHLRGTPLKQLLKDILFLREHTSWMRHDFEVTMRLMPVLTPQKLESFLEGNPVETYDNWVIVPKGALARYPIFGDNGVRRLIPYLKTALFFYWGPYSGKQISNLLLTETGFLSGEYDFWKFFEASAVLSPPGNYHELLELTKKEFPWFGSRS